MHNNFFVVTLKDVNLAQINCMVEDSWAHGSTLVNYMKMMEFTGLSGLVSSKLNKRF